MRNCTNCKHADWQKSKAGKNHPSGYGKCTFPIKIPVLPQAFYWMSETHMTPYGGFINRKRDLKDHCAYFAARTPGR
jgi:hypothetical protein